MNGMRFRLLGPLEVRADGNWTSIGTDKPRSLFACLLLNAGQIVPVETLVSELWGDAPPPTATNLISVYVHQLRRTIGDGDARVLVHRRPGYQVATSAEDTDWQRFESLAGRGRDALATGGAEAAARMLTEAEGLWRGRFLADVVPSALVSAEAARAAELRLSAAECRITADLECGRQAEVIPELRRMVVKHPLREGLWLLLMRALSAAGRHAEAVSAYGQARLVIAEQLGVDPGPELQQFHTGLITAANGVTPDDAPPGPAGAWADGGVPAQLPGDITDFTGRPAETARLRRILTQDQAAAGTRAARIIVVTGAPGAGKTTLAVHAAHQIRSLFPCGQLYVNMRGTSAAPAEPGAVLGRFLRDLGVDGNQIPDNAEDRAALYRTRLSGRRALIVLDDVKDAAQVRPLVPGSSSCAVVITSRSRMPYLVSNEFIELGALPPREALELFSRAVGGSRPEAEPEAVAEILRACGGLPLAIRICAARLVTRGQWPIAVMAARLEDEHRRLDEFRVGDLAVRGSFQVSYEDLASTGTSPAPARLLRLLGLWPGHRISLAAVASLTGERPADASRSLEVLIDANLLESPEPDWYGMHDLLRLFAAERSRAEDTAEDRDAAMRRLLQWYLEMTAAAAAAAAPCQCRIPSEEMSAAATVSWSVTEALAWYEREQDNAIIAVRQAAAAGWHEEAWQLATALSPSFFRRENWADCVTVSRIAVDSARAAGARHGEAQALHILGHGLQKLGETEAFACLKESLAIRRELGDLTGEAQTLLSLAEAHYRLEGPRDAYEHSLRDLDVLRQSKLGVALNNHGEFCLDLGKLDEAASCFQEHSSS